MAVRKQPDKQAQDALFLIERGLSGLQERLSDLLGQFSSVTDWQAALPANANAESTILGAIMLDNAAFAEAFKELVPDDFSLDSHRTIFMRIAELMAANHAVDIVTLAEALDANKERESIGGVAYLASLTEGLPRHPVIVDYIRIVKEKSALRKLIMVCTEAINKATADPREIGPRETAIGIRKWMSEQFNGKKGPRP